MMNSKQAVLVVSILALSSLSFSAFAQTRKTNSAAVNPVAATNQRILHSIFPTREADEAWYARNVGDQRGKMSDDTYHKFMKGADLDYRWGKQGYDYLQDMDYGITRVENRAQLAKTLSAFVPGIDAEEAARRTARGRINWTIWTGGNDRFWNYMIQATAGGLDLLKTISSYQSSTYRVPTVRSERWRDLGLVNEPCFQTARGDMAATAANKAAYSHENRFGLALDVRKPGCPGEPYEDPALYPGVQIGARGITVPVGSVYGYATGVVGLRLFPNPDFDEAAKAKWDAKRFYEDPNYYNDPNLVRPYRVGMACAFCHVGPNPSHPPKDFAEPQWADLNSNPGAQYFWVDRILLWNWKQNNDNFVGQLIRTSRPGALDTSLISSDMINNPRTMNAVYDLPARVKLAAMMGHRERLSGGELNNAQFNTVNEIAKDPNLVPNSAEGLRSLYDPKDQTVLAPRVLKDGSDSVGALGALNRVYVNIGLFSEEWVQHFIPVLGGPLVTAFPIKTAQEKSLYWQANEKQTPDVALFFLAATRPDKLSSAIKYEADQTSVQAKGKSAQAAKADKFLELTARYGLPHPDSSIVSRGKTVFAETCARCHSSKLPEKAYSFFNKAPSDPKYCNGPNYLSCWNSYWAYTQTEEFKTPMRDLVAQPDFLKDNFLSNDQRIPNNLLDSQLCSPVATNGLAGNIWNDFSSTSYKQMPGIGNFLSAAPSLTHGQTEAITTPVPAGGRGYLRPASLISLWSSAPLLGNNSLGKFRWQGTTEARLDSFDDSIRKLLWPELRANVPADMLAAGKEIVTYTPGTYTYAGCVSIGNGQLSCPGRKEPVRLEKLSGIMDVTTQDSYVQIPGRYLELTSPLTGIRYSLLKMIEVSLKTARFMGAAIDPADTIKHSEEKGDYLQLGPIPKGVPVNLISNLNMEKQGPLLTAVKNLVSAIHGIRKQKLTGDAARDFFLRTAQPSMVAASKCNDFVVTRGHYFGTKWSTDVLQGKAQELSDADKEALIAFLKQM